MRTISSILMDKLEIQLEEKEYLDLCGEVGTLEEYAHQMEVLAGRNLRLNHIRVKVGAANRLTMPGGYSIEVQAMREAELLAELVRYDCSEATAEQILVALNKIDVAKYPL